MSTEAPKDLNRIYKINDRYEPVGEKNVWVEFTQLARDYKATNMGQVSLYVEIKRDSLLKNKFKGFPDYMSNPYLVEKITETVSDPNPLLYQYTRSAVSRNKK